MYLPILRQKKKRPQLAGAPHLGAKLLWPHAHILVKSTLCVRSRHSAPRHPFQGLGARVQVYFHRPRHHEGHPLGAAVPRVVWGAGFGGGGVGARPRPPATSGYIDLYLKISVPAYVVSDRVLMPPCLCEYGYSL